MIKHKFGKDFIIVTPGIRPEWELTEGDDQERVTTPFKAIKNGSDYLVIGRPIRDAKKPLEAVEKIFNVNVTRTRTMQVKGKTKQRGRILGKRRSWKKAVVVLHEDFHIDLF